MTSKIEKLEKLLAEATAGPWFNENRLRQQLDSLIPFGIVKTDDMNVTGIIKPYDAELICALRNSAPLLLEIVKAAKGLAHGTDWNNGTHSAIYRSKLIDALKKFEESEL